MHQCAATCQGRPMPAELARPRCAVSTPCHATSHAGTRSSLGSRAAPSRSSRGRPCSSRVLWATEGASASFRCGHAARTWQATQANKDQPAMRHVPCSDLPRSHVPCRSRSRLSVLVSPVAVPGRRFNHLASALPQLILAAAVSEAVPSESGVPQRCYQVVRTTASQASATAALLCLRSCASKATPSAVLPCARCRGMLSWLMFRPLPHTQVLPA
jgi:hypothetical protein